MAKAFTKGQEVTIVKDWDRKGTVSYRHGVVHSCGNKQMVIFDPIKGDEIGRHFQPSIGDEERGGVFPRMTDEETVAFGLRVAEAILRRERSHFARCLRNEESGSGYLNAIRKDLDALHEPRVFSWDELTGGRL